MTTLHNSQNLTIIQEHEHYRLVITVTFHDESIVGFAKAKCPRCGGQTEVTLWELEGPGSNVNTVWMICGEDEPCQIDNEHLRWAEPVTFERDWDDI